VWDFGVSRRRLLRGGSRVRQSRRARNLRRLKVTNDGACQSPPSTFAEDLGSQLRGAGNIVLATASARADRPGDGTRSSDGARYLGPRGFHEGNPELLFTGNDTNFELLYGTPKSCPFPPRMRSIVTSLSVKEGRQSRTAGEQSGSPRALVLAPGGRGHASSPHRLRASMQPFLEPKESDSSSRTHRRGRRFLQCHHAREITEENAVSTPGHGWHSLERSNHAFDVDDGCVAIRLFPRRRRTESRDEIMMAKYLQQAKS